MWGAGADAYERVAERFAPIHAELIDRLAPRPDERWLDLGTGTGAVALLAAEAGAAVTALDIAPKMIEARAAAAAAGLEIAFDVGDAQALPYGDAFELEIHERVWYLEGDTPEDVYASWPSRRRRHGRTSNG